VSHFAAVHLGRADWRIDEVEPVSGEVSDLLAQAGFAGDPVCRLAGAQSQAAVPEPRFDAVICFRQSRGVLSGAARPRTWTTRERGGGKRRATMLA